MMERWIDLAPWALLVALCVGAAAAFFGLLVWWLKHPVDGDVPGDD